MVYTTETAVYDRTGFNSTTIQNLSGKTEAEVTTLVEGFISDSQDQMREDIEYPIRVRGEIHIADGQNNTFDIGPEDDPYASEADYDPADGLVEIYSLKRGNFKITKPYPEDCDAWTEYSSSTIATYWTAVGANATITSETTTKICGDYGVKVVFTGSDSIKYPSSQDLDLFIDPYDYIFFWIKTTTISPTLKIRIYTKDGTYMEEDIDPRQANVGQYYWIKIDSMDNPSSINWGDNVTRLQYITFSADAACTLYIDNLCLSKEWAFTSPSGILHVARADNVTGEGPPAEGTRYSIDYSYDPFLATVPGIAAEACEWLTGVHIVDYLRGIRYRKTSFEVYGTTLELDTDASREGLMGIRTYMMKQYWDCLRNWGHGSYGWV